MDLKPPEGQSLLYWLLGILATAFFAARGANWVRNQNAQDNRESTFQDNLQKRLDAALAEIDRLKGLLADKAVLEKRLRDRDRTITNLLDSLDTEQQKNARRWAPQSAFAPLDDLPKPKKD